MTWLITHRTASAWTAVLQLIEDKQPHQIQEVVDLMTSTADLAERTVKNHMRSASARGWIHYRQGVITLRNHQAITEALRSNQ